MPPASVLAIMMIAINATESIDSDFCVAIVLWLVLICCCLVHGNLDATQKTNKSKMDAVWYDRSSVESPRIRVIVWAEVEKVCAHLVKRFSKTRLIESR